jgi:hypothetical protein
MLIVMRILISAFQQMTMLVLDLSHNLHSSPFIHLVGQFVLIKKVVSIRVLLLKGVLVKFTGNSLPTNVGSDRAFIVDEAFDNWNYVGILCANIDNQTTLQGEKIC